MTYRATQDFIDPYTREVVKEHDRITCEKWLAADIAAALLTRLIARDENESAGAENQNIQSTKGDLKDGKGNSKKHDIHGVY